MFVSAYWHGIHPGYYMGMVSTTPCIVAENVMEAGVRRRLTAHGHWLRVYDACSWFFRTRMFDYMSVGFILRYFHYTWKYWSSVYFIGHLVTLLFYIIGSIAVRMRPKGTKKPVVNSDLGLSAQPRASVEQRQRLEEEHQYNEKKEL
jgi:lysophospholipid acyltransferase 7